MLSPGRYVGLPEEDYNFDFANPLHNDLLVCNKFIVIENEKNKRPDVVLLVNGLPMMVIELKNPTDEHATVQKAYTQLQNYKKAIPSLFFYNGSNCTRPTDLLL